MRRAPVQRAYLFRSMSPSPSPPGPVFFIGPPPDPLPPEKTFDVSPPSLLAAAVCCWAGVASSSAGCGWSSEGAGGSPATWPAATVEGCECRTHAQCKTAAPMHPCRVTCRAYCPWTQATGLYAIAGPCSRGLFLAPLALVSLCNLSHPCL
jgi:hypothetical protein